MIKVDVLDGGELGASNPSSSFQYLIKSYVVIAEQLQYHTQYHTEYHTQYHTEYHTEMQLVMILSVVQQLKSKSTWRCKWALLRLCWK